MVDGAWERRRPRRLPDRLGVNPEAIKPRIRLKPGSSAGILPVNPDLRALFERLCSTFRILPVAAGLYACAPITDYALLHAPGVETPGWSSTKSASADWECSAPAACRPLTIRAGQLTIVASHRPLVLGGADMRTEH